MGFFKWIWRHSIINQLINTIRYRRRLNNDHRKFDQIIYGGTFTTLIRRYLKIDLSRDWIGRLYGIINPNIDINGKFDPSTMIIEVDGDNTNNNEFVYSWIYKQLNLVSYIFNFKEMYDVITVDINHVGPTNQDNFLVVFDFNNRQELAYWRKRFILHFIALAAITGIALLIIL